MTLSTACSAERSQPWLAPNEVLSRSEVLVDPGAQLFREQLVPGERRVAAMSKYWDAMEDRRAAWKRRAAGPGFGKCQTCGLKLSVLGAADDPAPGAPHRKRVMLGCMNCRTRKEVAFDPSVEW
ncbi:hypothetical protein [Roseomonas harenae]|uniref:hypothetical protein n=1 Tax=Muricoccus harenae TaxID=2692566 RepID=UPI0013312EAF|nr:hypothetical protein [Roseomonas harenae]